jgi:hypothetical protein
MAQRDEKTTTDCEIIQIYPLERPFKRGKRPFIEDRVAYYPFT